MTVQAIRLAKTNKTFYRNSFRKVIVLLFFSLILNGLLGFGIYTKLVNLKEPKYYATSGVAPPVRMEVLEQPNYSSEALLETDPVPEPDKAIMKYD